LPLPLAPLVTVSQLALLVAVHEHQLPTPTSNVPVSPAYDIAWLEGVSVNTHGAAACVAAYVLPAIVAVVVRAAAPFTDAASVTVPLPVPDAPAVTVSQLGSLLAAVHEHQLPVATVTLVDPPPYANDDEDGEIE
jgi:hypothetical protein